MLGGRIIVHSMSKSWIEQGFGRDRPTRLESKLIRDWFKAGPRAGRRSVDFEGIMVIVQRAFTSEDAHSSFLPEWHTD
jgi:hypothetical protein